MIDWTAKNNRSNSSDDFERLCKEVERLIRDSAASLINGRADQVARLILAQLAHEHGLALRPTPSPRVLDAGRVEPRSSAEYHQRRGVAFDIITEALLAYREFMRDDDYDAQGCLDKIIGRMTERASLYDDAIRTQFLASSPNRSA